ncbi:MAG: lipoprotein signal peptidase [Prevotellaceae bacterium]|nr:lipoprotein signal peptidase [Prevotellaceae bacterium]
MNLNRNVYISILYVMLLVIDQSIKLWVKTNMCLQESIHITDWFYITFIENNGMAYGMAFMPKYALSLFRFIASCALIWFIRKQIRLGARTLWVVLLTLIAAGAAGNLIDCMFYGMVFTDSTLSMPAITVVWGDGYSSFLQGRVVDMFYFPIIVTTYPEWFPVWGGQPFIFFSPIFNFADACISVGVVTMLIFCRKELSKYNAHHEKV